MESGVSDEFSCCKMICSTVPSISGRNFLLATNFALTKLTVTVPPTTMQCNVPSSRGASLERPRTRSTSARRDFKGSIPLQDDARAQCDSDVTEAIATTRLLMICRARNGFCFKIFMQRMLAQSALTFKVLNSRTSRYGLRSMLNRLFSERSHTFQ